MSVVIATSTEADPATVAEELHRRVGGLQPTLIVFFVSSRIPSEALGRELKARFGAVPSLGCTTAGELAEGEMREGSAVLMAFDANTIEGAWVDKASNPEQVHAALDRIAEGAGASPGLLSPQHYVGIVLHDGLQAMEEAVMTRLCNLTNVPFVGGSAGDDLQFERTVCFCNFEPCSAASVLALLRPTVGYRVLKTQSFRVSDKVLEATEVDEASRRVKAFNGRPAAEEYARQLGVPVAEVSQHFRSNPVGLVVQEGEPFVRGMQRVDGSDILFFCQILEGTQVNLLHAQDIVEATRADLKKALDSLGTCSALLDFDCVERRAALQEVDALSAYGDLFRKLPAVGFSTYGESYIAHINQTATMLLFA